MLVDFQHLATSFILSKEKPKNSFTMFHNSFTCVSLAIAELCFQRHPSFAAVFAVEVRRPGKLSQFSTRTNGRGREMPQLNITQQMETSSVFINP
jgi:hypothetical protein